MPHTCEDCGQAMRVRDTAQDAAERRVLSWECDHCGNIEIASRAARIMREETQSAAARFSARAMVQKLPDGTVGVSLNRDAARKVGLRPGHEVLLRGVTGGCVEVVPSG